jgi:hypothetical protein
VDRQNTRSGKKKKYCTEEDIQREDTEKEREMEKTEQTS